MKTVIIDGGQAGLATGFFLKKMNSFPVKPDIRIDR